MVRFFTFSIMNLIEEADVKKCRNEAGSKKVLTLKSDQRKCYIDTHHRPLPHPSPLLTMSNLNSEVSFIQLQLFNSF